MESKTSDLVLLQSQFQQLKEDFLHNEGVLRERDEELEACEAKLRDAMSHLADSIQQQEAAQAVSSSAQSELSITKERYAPYAPVRPPKNCSSPQQTHRLTPHP